MKIRTILLGLAGVAVVVAVGGLAFREIVVKPRMQKAHAAIQTLALEFDADKDTKLSRAEVDAAIAARFASADANADGKIDLAEFKTSADELRAKFPDHPFHRDPSSRYERIVGALDWNRDGGLQLDEVRGVVQAAAGFADRNADGFIAKDEMNWRHRGRHGHRAEARMF